MTSGYVFAYVSIASVLLWISLATTARPRSAGLICLAAAFWPVTLAAITLQVLLSKARPQPASRALRTTPGLPVNG